MRRFVVVLAILVALLSMSFIAQAQSNTSQQTHTVQAGETLYRISLRYGVSLTALVQANNISNPNLIFVGQVLIIPTGGTTPPPVVTPPPSGGNPPPAGTSYVVQRGDTLGSIAARFGTTYQAIAAANGIANP